MSNCLGYSRHLLAIIILPVIISALLGCDSAPVPGGGNGISDYRLDGVLVKNVSQNSTIIAANLEKNGKAMSSATLLFGEDTLKFNDTNAVVDSIYSFINLAGISYPNSQYQLNISEDVTQIANITVQVPDTFSITGIVPTNGQWRPTDGAVQLSWSGSANSDTYILAAVKANGTRAGYSAYAGELSTSGNIPMDIFYNGVVVDTGLYYFYVYAVSGVPDKSLADLLLPVPILSQGSDNISSIKLDGHFGSITVTAFDTLRAVVQ